MVKVLFVCHGNICRSTMAEFVFKDMVSKNGLSDKIYIASAATSTEEIGNGIHPGTRNVLRNRKIPFDHHSAVQMIKGDYDKYDYIIGMDSWNIRNILAISGGDDSGKVYKLLDFTERGGDIADPWYTGDFDTTYDDVSDGCEGLLRHLSEKYGFA